LPHPCFFGNQHLWSLWLGADGSDGWAVAIVAVGGVAAIAQFAADSKASADQSVTYTARVFMRGMKVSLPSGGWTVSEDAPGELKFAAPAGPMDGAVIGFWLDPRASAAHGLVLSHVGRTPAALIKWLRGNSNFVVSAPATRRIAHGLLAKSVNLDLSVTAPREDPSCPGPCLTYFVIRGPGYNHEFGTGRGEPIRFYFATLRRGNKRTHTFVIDVYAPSAKAFRAVTLSAEKIVAGLRLPAKVSAG
jgi:hypothetical protein